MRDLSFEELRAANVTRAEEWPGPSVDLSFTGNELAGEIGEALEQAIGVILLAAAGGRASNIVKKLERERLGVAGSRASLEQLANEVADVVICTDLVARKAGFNLAEAVRRKFNITSEKVGLSTRL